MIKEGYEPRTLETKVSCFTTKATIPGFMVSQKSLANHPFFQMVNLKRAKISSVNQPTLEGPDLTKILSRKKFPAF